MTRSGAVASRNIEIFEALKSDFLTDEILANSLIFNIYFITSSKFIK